MKPKAPPSTVLVAMAKLNERLADAETDPKAAAEHRGQAERHRRDAAEAAIADWPEAFRVQMEAALHDQAELLEETQRMMEAWTRRRQEAMESGFRTLQKLSASRDVAEMAAAYNEWLSSSMGRIMADMAAAQEGAMRLASLGQQTMNTLTPKAPLGTKKPRTG
jgi:small-conductance mechanosensitive channel